MKSIEREREVFTLGATPGQDSSVCNGSDSLYTGAVPKTAHNKLLNTKKTNWKPVKLCSCAPLPVYSGMTLGRRIRGSGLEWDIELCDRLLVHEVIRVCDQVASVHLVVVCRTSFCTFPR